MTYVVPMYESERGWGAKVDGYAGPFDTEQQANAFRDAYNRKYNNESRVPDYYIMALDAIKSSGQRCEYLTSVDGQEYK